MRSATSWRASAPSGHCGPWSSSGTRYPGCMYPMTCTAGCARCRRTRSLRREPGWQRRPSSNCGKSTASPGCICWWPVTSRPPPASWTARGSGSSTMDIDLRPEKKLRESAAARSALAPIIEAVCSAPVDLSRLRVVCDWIQYRKNFRDIVVGRPVADSGTEIAIDLRRCADIEPDSLAPAVKQALSVQGGGRALEPWVVGRDSCIWRFNALYWQALSAWEAEAGREYRPS